MKEKSALSTSGYLDLFPLTTNHVSAFLDSLHVSLYVKLKYILWEAEIHTVEEEISQLVLCNKKGLDKKFKKKKKRKFKKKTPHSWIEYWLWFIPWRWHLQYTPEQQVVWIWCLFYQLIVEI